MRFGRHEARAILLTISFVVFLIISGPQLLNPPREPGAASPGDSAEAPLRSPSPPPESPAQGSARAPGTVAPANPSRTRLWSSSSGVNLPPRLEAAKPRCASDGGVPFCGLCRTERDCPAGMGCAANRETGRFECMDHECDENLHCASGLVCRPVTSGATGSVVRRCVVAGTRGEGNSCDALFVSQADACDDELVCHRGICRAACWGDAPPGCASGFVCRQGAREGACAPDCRTSGCPKGERCKQLNDTEFQCLAEVKGTCPETPCAEGGHCSMRLSRGRGVFWCSPPCDPFRSDSCGEGQVCGMSGTSPGICYRQCDPRVDDSCGEGWLCAPISEEKSLWGCKPVILD